MTASEREAWGRRVREIWVAWAKEQPNPKPSWLLPWEALSEPDREVDRRIGETIANEAVLHALRSRWECECGALNDQRTGPCVGCRLSAPKRVEIAIAMMPVKP